MSSGRIIYLGLRKDRTRTKRNIMLIVAIGAIFGLIFTINLMIRGIEKTYFNMSNRVAGDKVVIIATSESQAGINNRSEITKDIERFGGHVIGDVERIGAFGSIVLPSYVLNNIDASNIQDDSMPILVSTIFGSRLLDLDPTKAPRDLLKKKEYYQDLNNRLVGQTFADQYGAKYHVIGLMPDNFFVRSMSFEQLDPKNSCILNPVLNLISIPSSAQFIIKNGKENTWQKGETPGTILVSGEDEILAVFDHSTDAYDYFMNGKGFLGETGGLDRAYMTTVVAGKSPINIYAINIIKQVARGAYIVLIIAAFIVSIFTSIKIVDQDKNSIKMYQSLGATHKQIRLIYMSYFASIIIKAAILSFLIAAIIVLTFSALNQDLIQAQAILGFGIMNPPYIIWYGVDMDTLLIFATMIILAPACVFINGKRL